MKGLEVRNRALSMPQEAATVLAHASSDAGCLSRHAGPSQSAVGGNQITLSL